MKEVNIKSIIINSEEETLNFETKGKYNQKEKTLEFFEDDLFVKIQFSNKQVIINRINEDYNLNLIFKLNKINICFYQVKSLGLEINLKTLKLWFQPEFILLFPFNLYHISKRHIHPVVYHTYCFVRVVCL